MSILDLLFPEKCLGCGVRGRALCEQCIQSIPAALPPESAHLFAVYEYGNKLVSRAVHECKYYRREGALRALAYAAIASYAEYLAEYHPGITREQIILVPIPQHRSKSRDRGFNQSARICTWLDTLGTVEALLTKTRATTPQAHVASRKRRLSNLTHTMHAQAPLAPKRLYIVIDDVTTTGATLLEARRALRDAGARHVIGFALAHGYKL